MTFRATINENGQVAFPREALEALGLAENSSFEFEVEGSTLTLKREREAKLERNLQAFDEWFAKYAGSKREQLLADGYKSVDEYMKVIRPEW